MTLHVGSGQDSFSVRRFEVHEEMSSLFSLTVWVVSPNEDVDTEAIVGRPGGLLVQSQPCLARGSGQRCWTGLVQHLEQVHTEEGGLTTYLLRIVPKAWLLTQRTGNRVLQRLTAPEIVKLLLTEMEIEAEWHIDEAQHPKLPTRTQYRETDYLFMGRILEEAGISFFFRDSEEKGTVLVFADAPQSGDERPGGPIDYTDRPGRIQETDARRLLDPTVPQGKEMITGLRFAQQIRPGKVTLREKDFRRPQDFALAARSSAGAAASVEDKLEHYMYSNGSFLVEMGEAAAKEHDGVGKAASLLGGVVSSTLSASAKKLAGGIVGDFAGSLVGDVAANMTTRLASLIAAPMPAASGGLAGDDRGAARFDEKHGQALATRRLHALRTERQAVDFSTSCIDMHPGTVFSMQGHPRQNLGPHRRLLVTELRVEGTHDGQWEATCHAVFADQPYHPPMKTPKPAIWGHQSAVVVGPPGEEIHTDEFGRVRVQLPWDREGQFDHASHCWVRVAQGAAGAGFGMIQLPRVGQEVLVGFLEGDPDQPVVLGSLFSTTTPVPHGLPGHKTRASWKSSTYPGGGGSNEVMMEDAKGRELLYLLAQRNMQQIVNRDRGAIVGGVDSTVVGEKLEAKVALPMGSPADSQTEIVMVNRRIELTTGDARIILENDTITLWAKKGIKVLSDGDTIEIETRKGDVRVQGGPNVKINCPPEKKKKDDKKKPAKPSAYSADGKEGKEIGKSMEEAKAMLADKEKSLNRWNDEDKAQVKKWFGKDDDATRDKLLDRIHKEQKLLDEMGVENFQPAAPEEKDPDQWAYTYPDDKTHKVYLDDLFWKSAHSGQSSKPGTIVHELSHFDDIAGTGDPAYGPEDSKSLAATSPTKAMQNADNFEYFIENLP